MHGKRNGYRKAAWFLAIVLGIAGHGPLSAQGIRPGMTRQQIRSLLTPIYHQLELDPVFRSHRESLVGRHDNPETIQRYLKFMPISPLEYLQIDMHERRYEIMVPSFIAEWHLRWIELHQTFARELYGDVRVDAAIARLPVEPPGQYAPAPGTPPAALATSTVGTNRNVAATDLPGPESYQGEIQIAVNPNDPDEMVAAANTWDSMSGSCGDLGTQAIFYSSDAGATWDYTCAPDESGYAGLTCAGGLVFATQVLPHAHILGTLPGENKKDVLRTARHGRGSRSAGICVA